MEKIYNDPPDNIKEAETYTLENASNEIIAAKAVIFYDACSYRYHMNAEDPGIIISFIKSINGIIVLTMTVLMELSSQTGNLGEKELRYLSKLHTEGIKIVIVREEEIYDVLRSCYSNIESVNTIFSNAVKVVVPAGSLLKQQLANCNELKKDLFQTTSRNTQIAKAFFEFARRGKTASDSLGETLMIICMMLLSYLPSRDYKILAFSDDKGAARLLGKVKCHLRDNEKKIAVITTPTLCWYVWTKNGGELSKENIANLLSKTTRGENIKVKCSEMYEMDPTEKTFKAEELAQRICETEGFRVYL